MMFFSKERNEIKMIKEEFAKKIKDFSKEIGVQLKEKQIDQFYTYMELLLEWNEKINLTAITEPEEIIQKHFIDSITISKYIEDNKKMIDVGTGAGFPGIPLKIIREDIDILLLDSLNKRIHFLDEVIEKLKLSHIQTIHARVEEFGKNKNYRESFDIATSRAVANMSTLSEYLIPLVKVGGICIGMKGADVEEEVQQSKKAISILGGEFEKIEKFTLPKSDIGRSIILITKVKNTPSKYPRKPGTPGKEPLK